jgi:hypothetical protein
MNQYDHHGGNSAFYFSLEYDGHVRVMGTYPVPAIAFDFASSPYTALHAHVRQTRLAGLVGNSLPKSQARWWFEPIFCGWGSQNYQSKVIGGKAKDDANQASYEAFLHTHEAKEVHPGTIVIDDQWQTAYATNTVDPDKWPDMPGFIQIRHEAGQHVLSQVGLHPLAKSGWNYHAADYSWCSNQTPSLEKGWKNNG